MTKIAEVIGSDVELYNTVNDNFTSLRPFVNTMIWRRSNKKQNSGRRCIERGKREAK